MLTNPILQHIAPFNATQIFNLNFSVIGGDAINKNQLIIERISNNSTIYNQTQTTFNHIHIIPANTMINGVDYRFRVRTGNISNEWSDWSNSIIVRPLATPIVTITNIINETVDSQNYTFQGSFSQPGGDTLSSYRFILYSQNMIIISTSGFKYDNLIRHQFENLENNVTYNIVLQVRTFNGMESSSAIYRFVARYSQPIIANQILLENSPKQGGVEVSTQIVRIKGEIVSCTGGGTVTYEGTPVEWANLKNCIIKFEEGFTLMQDYTIRMWAKNIDDDKWFLKLYSNGGYIEMLKRTVYITNYTIINYSGSFSLLSTQHISNQIFSSTNIYYMSDGINPRMTVQTSNFSGSNVLISFNVSTNTGATMAKLSWYNNTTLIGSKEFLINSNSRYHVLKLGNVNFNRFMVENTSRYSSGIQSIEYTNFKIYNQIEQITPEIRIYAYMYSNLNNVIYTMFTNPMNYNISPSQNSGNVAVSDYNVTVSLNYKATRIVLRYNNSDYIIYDSNNGTESYIRNGEIKYFSIEGGYVNSTGFRFYVQPNIIPNGSVVAYTAQSSSQITISTNTTIFIFLQHKNNLLNLRAEVLS